MFRKVLAIAVTLCLLHFATARRIERDIPVPGRCPRLKTVGNFDIGRFMGTWHGIKRLPLDPKPGINNLACFALHYNEVTSTYIQGRVSGKINGTHPFQAPIQVTVLDLRNPSVWSVKYKQDIFTNSVLATDYTNYALIYLCRDIPLGGGEKVEGAAILSRHRTLDNRILFDLIRLLSQFKTDLTRLYDVDQSVC